MSVPLWLFILWGPLHVVLGALVYEAGRNRGKHGDKAYQAGFVSGQKVAMMARAMRRGMETAPPDPTMPQRKG